MSGEKLKELERGPVSHALPEEAPLSPPKFITQVCVSLVYLHCGIFETIDVYFSVIL